jgi:2-polyprenyl-3-methyl-5-hydroxy-6-metoxy-1,4-benzoquinol methylase
MDERVTRTLVELNHSFYDQFAAEFSETRASPQPGFQKLIPLLSKFQSPHVLDVGCGNGRFGHYLMFNGIQAHYVGVDFSENLAKSANPFPGMFIVRDLSAAGCLEEFTLFDIIVCLSTLQHIPGYANRLRLMIEMRKHLKADGRLIVANWQFMNSERQRRKILPWELIDLSADLVEANDYLLSWQRGGTGRRYVTYINPDSIQELARKADLSVIESFYSDGREGNLNLYTIMSG